MFGFAAKYQNVKIDLARAPLWAHARDANAHTYARRQTDGVRSVASCPAARKAARALQLYEKIVKETKKEKNKLCPSFLTFCQFLEHKKDRK